MADFKVTIIPKDGIYYDLYVRYKGKQYKKPITRGFFDGCPGMVSHNEQWIRSHLKDYKDDPDGYKLVERDKELHMTLLLVTGIVYPDFEIDVVLEQIELLTDQTLELEYNEARIARLENRVQELEGTIEIMKRRLGSLGNNW